MAEVPVFLMKEDLEKLTGLKRPARQCQWLAHHGYRFDVNAAGRPVVLMSAVEQKLGPTQHPRQTPNFDALRDGT